MGVPRGLGEDIAHEGGGLGLPAQGIGSIASRPSSPVATAPAARTREMRLAHDVTCGAVPGIARDGRAKASATVQWTPSSLGTNVTEEASSPAARFRQGGFPIYFSATRLLSTFSSIHFMIKSAI